jgi:two-component system OmpR family sensor kinase
LHVALPGGGDVFVAPDFARVDAAARWLALGFLTLELLAAAASWFIGRRIARRAMGPIEAIRAELERFAGGDFTPRAIGSTRSQDLDALVRAYNGAAAQVANALAERARVEAEMRQFLGEAGHQMRTPLTVISGSLDLLDRAAGDDAAVRARTVPLMRTEAARLRRLVERLFTLARLQQDEPPQTEVVDVRDVVRDVVDRANAAQATLVSVRDVLAFAYVRADPDEVHDAVANLVENAAKYGRGHVTVALSNRDDDVLVRVIDDGPGISPDDRSRLFERFFRGENAQGVEGTGLGLAIAERAAARAGGAVALESSGPAGSTFRIAFPKFREFADRRTAVALD